MITNTGKNILAKYLIGQAPAYASYMAIGCGPKPLPSDGTLGDYSNKNSMDFEMFRVPIISRGYVNEDGVDKIVFTAEMPTEERYEITEVGIYSAGSNPSASTFDSRALYSFTQGENWEYHTQTEATAIPIVYEPLDGLLEDNVINQTYPVFQTNADNKIFTEQGRSERYERCRYLNNIVMMRGDTSDLSIDGSGNIQVNSSTHIHFNGVDVNLDRNAPTDELRLAFSLVNKDGSEPVDVPSQVMLLLEFASADPFGAGEFARFEVNITHTPGDPLYDFSTNRYFVVTKQLQELVKSAGFSWSSVNIAKVAVCVLDSLGDPSDQFYVALDALRIENVTSQNPLYGLTGYTVIRNTDSATVVKVANSTNFIEFRFAVGVQ